MRLMSAAISIINTCHEQKIVCWHGQPKEIIKETNGRVILSFPCVYFIAVLTGTFISLYPGHPLKERKQLTYGPDKEMVKKRKQSGRKKTVKSLIKKERPDNIFLFLVTTLLRSQAVQRNKKKTRMTACDLTSTLYSSFYIFLGPRSYSKY